MQTYKVSDLIVIKLDAGKDREGSPRRCYVLAHPLDGFLDATDDAGAGEAAVEDFVDTTSPDAPALVAELMARVTHKIDTSPSYYRTMVACKLTRDVEYRIVTG